MLPGEYGWANLSFKQLLEQSRASHEPEPSQPVQNLPVSIRTSSPVCWSMLSPDSLHIMMSKSPPDPIRPKDLDPGVEFVNNLYGHEDFLKTKGYIKTLDDLYQMAQETQYSARDKNGTLLTDVLKGDMPSGKLAKIAIDPGMWFGNPNIDSYELLNLCVTYHYQDPQGTIALEVYPFVRAARYGDVEYSAVKREDATRICPDRSVAKI